MKPVPSAKQLESGAFQCAVALLILLVCAIIDAADGVVSMRRGPTYKFSEDPEGFWGVMLSTWGYFGLLAAVGAISLGIGALVARGVEKASTEE